MALSQRLRSLGRAMKSAEESKNLIAKQAAKATDIYMKNSLKLTHTYFDLFGYRA